MTRFEFKLFSRPARAASTAELAEHAPASSARDASAPAWHDALAPVHLLKGVFSSSNPLFEALPRPLFNAIKARAEAVMAAPIDQTTCRHLLAYMGNSHALLNPGEDQGLRSDEACWTMWQLLHKLASKTPNTPQEQAAMQRLLLGYRSYFISTLINNVARAKPGHERTYLPVQMRVLAAGLSPTQAAIMHTGFIGHTTLTRVSMLSDAGNDAPLQGSLMANYRQQVHKLLGASTSAWVGKSFQLGMSGAMVRTPLVQSLITSTHALVHPGSDLGNVQITWRNARGNTDTASVPWGEAEQFLLQRSLRPVANGIKATIHNGGSGARLDHHGATRTYDQRLLVPLIEAQEVFTTLQKAKMSPPSAARYALLSVSQYDGIAVASVALSPAIHRQDLGNCTIHSQKLCLLYELQHLRDLGDGEALNARHGSKLFARLWTEGFARVRERIQDPATRRAAKDLYADVVREMTAMLDPQVSAPARQAPVRIPTPVERSRRPSDFVAPTARPTLPPRPAALPMQQAPAALAAWAERSLGEVPPAELMAWLQSIKGTCWVPVNIQELEGYERLLEHMKGPRPDKRTRQDASAWIDGTPLFQRGFGAATRFLANPRPDHPDLVDIRGLLFVWINDANMSVRALPNEFRKAWDKASTLDPLTQHLRNKVFADMPLMLN